MNDIFVARSNDLTKNPSTSDKLGYERNIHAEVGADQLQGSVHASIRRIAWRSRCNKIGHIRLWAGG